MMRYRAIAIRSDGWWAIEIADHPGIFSQARRLVEVAPQAAKALSLTLDTDVGPQDVDVEPQFEDDDLASAMDGACRQRHDAERAAALAGTATVDAIVAGVGAGLAQRDIGTLLGVSFQYVSKVLAKHQEHHGVRSVNDVR